MKDVFHKTFGGLDRAYYLRHLFFGCLFFALVAFVALQAGGKTAYTMLPFALVCTLLYPYSRFVYEGVVGYIMGNNVFFINAGVMLFTKYMTMGLCWAFSVFIAPVGLAYLYWQHSKHAA
jgi:hypothetical protein